jgi:hypothetical protein
MVIVVGPSSLGLYLGDKGDGAEDAFSLVSGTLSVLEASSEQLCGFTLPWPIGSNLDIKADGTVYHTTL